MIDALAFHNFKGLQDVALTLERFTIFVGPNGSGKTTILEGVYYLSKCLTANPLVFFSEDRDLSLLQTRNATEEVLLSCDLAQLQLRLIASEPKDPPFQMWNIDIDWRSLDQTPITQRPTFAAVFLQLNPARLAKPSYIHDLRPKMASDGQGLASVLAFLSMNRPNDFREVQVVLHSVIPSVKGVRLERARVQTAEKAIMQNGSLVTVPSKEENMGEKLLLDMENGSIIPAHLASAGTLLVLGILAAVFTSDSPCILLLDDLDHGLHPKAQKDLIAALRRLLTQRPDLQILATSHSPYLVDNFAPEEIRLTTLHQDGSVACAPMRDHPSFSKWKDAMSPGEFWSMVGEKWITRNEVTEAAS